MMMFRGKINFIFIQILKDVIHKSFLSLLSEIDDFDHLSEQIRGQRKVYKDKEDESVSKHCSPVLLSPACAEAKACPSLLCLSCNLSVVRADNLQWDESTDYLFLRNNVPNMSRLRGEQSNHCF